MNIQLSALCYVHAWEHQRPIDGGIAFAELLGRCRLDYSVASLKRIDAFLDILRLKHKPAEAAFIADDAQQNLLFLLAFYTGEVIGRSLGARPVWHTYDDIVALDAANAGAGRVFSNSASCNFADRDGVAGALFQPLVHICARLFEAPSGQSVRLAAEALMPAACREGTMAELPLPPLPSLPPQGWHVDIADALARFSPVRRRAVNMTRPGWIEGDDLRTVFDNEQLLLEEGHIVWGALIQANNGLFESGHLFSAPGEVLYDPSGRMSPACLQEVACHVFGLKGEKQTDPELAHVAAYLADERIRVFGLDAPGALLPYPLKISTTFFEQAQMPNMRLTLPFVPLLVSERCPGVVLFLPSIFWPDKFREDWVQAGARGQAQQQHVADGPTLYVEGLAYFHGTGTMSDLGKARALWDKAARLGNADSQFMLGTLAENGAGGATPDLHLAGHYYRAAAEQGHVQAQLALGKLCMRIDGPAPDLVEANEWVGKAAAQGSAEARELLATLAMDEAVAPSPGVLSWLRQRSR
ncbi:MAG: tetratricopeptide repeat protein [Massilia sp.]